MIDAADSESSLEDTPPVTSHSLPSNHDAQQPETPPSNGNHGEDAGSAMPDDQQSQDKQVEIHQQLVFQNDVKSLLLSKGNFSCSKKYNYQVVAKLQSTMHHFLCFYTV